MRPNRPHRLRSLRSWALPPLAALTLACLPSMPEGERGTQCWTERAESLSECYVAALRCEESVDFSEPFEEFECSETFATCLADAEHEAQQCEPRPGCIATLDRCTEDCGLQQDSGLQSLCRDTCVRDFQRCAPWYQPECERQCQYDQFESLDCQVASDLDDFIDCEQERVECVVACY